MKEALGAESGRRAAKTPVEIYGASVATLFSRSRAYSKRGRLRSGR